MSTMPCISLWQPWASALFGKLANGEALKPHETRGWAMPESFAGIEVAIQAAKRDTGDEREFWREIVLRTPAYREAFARMGIKDYVDLPRSCVLGTVVFSQSVSTKGHLEEQNPVARDWGNYSPERFAWPVVKSTLLDKPFPCTGKQGFFRIPLI